MKELLLYNGAYLAFMLYIFLPNKFGTVRSLLAGVVGLALGFGATQALLHILGL